MTRDEVYATLKQAIEYGRSTVPVRLAYDQLVAHDAEQRRVIEDLQKRVEELIDRRNNFHREVVEWRGIEFDNVCTECNGSGYKVYENTTTYPRGAGGQAITTSVCNICWGSGDKSRPRTSWLKIEGIQRQLELLKADDAERCTLIRDMEEEERKKDAVIEQQAQQIARLENKLGCSRSHLHEDMNQICELQTEVARLKNELSHWSWVRFKQLEEENTKLREALENCLAQIQDDIKQCGPCEHDVNICVCPLKILAAEAQQAIKEVL